MRTFPVGIIVLLCSSPLAAETPASPAATAEEARAAYDAGTTEYDLGHYKEALVLFEKAFRLRHVPALLFNIAQSHRMLGDLKSAAALLRSFIAKDPTSKVVPQARQVLAQVESALAQKAQAESAQPTEVRAQEPEAPPAQMQPQPPAPSAAAELQPPMIAVQAAPPQAPPPAPAALLPAAPAPARTPAPAVPNPAPRAEASSGRLFTWIAAGGAVVAFGGAAFFGSKSSAAKSDLAGAAHPAAQVPQLQDDQVSNAKRANALFLASGLLAAVSATFFVLEF